MRDKTGVTGMSKKKTLAYTSIIVSFAIFNLLVFTIIKNRGSAFWINYGFTFLAFLVQPVIWELTLGRNNSLKSKFLGFPILYVGMTYFCIQIILFVVLVLIPKVSPWLVLAINSIVAGVAIISLAIVEIGKDEVSRIEEKVSRKRFFIDELRIEVEMLARSQSDPLMKKTLEELVEKIRFSDPMSSNLLSAIEEEIRLKVVVLKETDVSRMVEAVKDIEALIVRRNSLVKTSK